MATTEPVEHIEIDVSQIDDTITPDVAPKRRTRSDAGKPRGSRSTSRKTPTSRAPRRGGRSWVREQCASLVALGNLAISYLSPLDALSTEAIPPATRSESDLLTDALTAEAMSSDRIMRWLMAAAGVSPHILMIQALVLIIVPRLQRRGIIPAPKLTAEQEAILYDFAREAARAENNGQYPTADTDVSVSMETGRTSLTNWPDR